VLIQNLDTRLKQLEADRNRLLMEEEERWCLKSRATWIQCGDKNSKFFHNFASYRRNKKHLGKLRMISTRLYRARRQSRRKQRGISVLFIKNPFRM
jgi:hypothetical protein